MHYLFDPATALGLTVIAVVAGLIVSLVVYLAKKVVNSHKKQPSQRAEGSNNVQIIGEKNQVSQGWEIPNAKGDRK